MLSPQTLKVYADLLNLNTDAHLRDFISHETSGGSVITVEVPGCEREHIEVTAADRLLTVVYNPPADTKTYMPRFKKRYSLSKDADVSTIKAETKNGLLFITVGKVKAQTSTVNRITVN
jgi:HSP20 family molecular chaperone IbpA